MTKDQLLQQRFKVIGPYPDSEFKVGDILDRDWCRYENDDEDSGVTIWKISDFPHLFEPLPWWKDRDVKDMPEYVRFTDNYMDFKKGQVFECDNWMTPKEGQALCIGFKTGAGEHNKCAVPAGRAHLEPATKEEYDNYIMQKEGSGE